MYNHSCFAFEEVIEEGGGGEAEEGEAEEAGEEREGRKKEFQERKEGKIKRRKRKMKLAVSKDLIVFN